MATFTRVVANELAEWLGAYDLGSFEGLTGIAAGSVNSNFEVRAGHKRYFLRVYEEQDFAGAVADANLAFSLSRANIRTAVPVTSRDGKWVGLLADKPAALFEWAAGEMRCQASVTPRDMQQLGSELAKVHEAGLTNLAGPSRFGVENLFERLTRIDKDPRFAPLTPSLHKTLETSQNRRSREAPSGLIHGDLFRDNVLWSGDTISALIDFESASLGFFIYDIAVTMLAWCMGETLDASLARALIAGYQKIRPLDDSERQGIFEEARFAALRFTITRITDYAMRTTDGAERVVKDYRRFEKRLAALDEMGDRGFALFLGLNNVALP